MEKQIENIDLVDVTNELSKYITDSSGSWVVMFQGKRLKFHSNKSVWSKKNHASCAFTNFISNIYGGYYNRERLEKLGFKSSKGLAHYLIDNNIVTIEQL